jgi:hypothetical protein
MNKWLGFDLGTQTLGIAIGQRQGFIFPRPVYRFPKGAYGIVQKQILVLMQEEHVNHLVFGIPVNRTKPFDANFESQPLRSLFPQFLLRDPDLRITEGEKIKRFLSNDFQLKAQKPFFLSPFKTKLGVPE